MQKLEDEFYSKAGVNQRLTKGCASITINHMKGFAEWVDSKFYIKLSDNSINWSDANGKVFTINELIEKYFESLK